MVNIDQIYKTPAQRKIYKMKNQFLGRSWAINFPDLICGGGCIGVVVFLAALITFLAKSIFRACAPTALIRRQTVMSTAELNSLWVSRGFINKRIDRIARCCSITK